MDFDGTTRRGAYRDGHLWFDEVLPRMSCNDPAPVDVSQHGWKQESTDGVRALGWDRSCRLDVDAVTADAGQANRNGGMHPGRGTEPRVEAPWRANRAIKRNVRISQKSSKHCIRP